MLVVRLTLAIAFGLFLISPTQAQSQSIIDAIEKLDESRDASCKASSSSLSSLIRLLEASANSNGNVSDIAEGIRALAVEDFWVSEDQRESLRALTSIGATIPAVGPILAEAQASAMGELKSIVFQHLHDPIQMIESLDSLAEVNASLERSNPYYVAEIKLTLAEYLSDYSFRSIDASGWPLPLSSEERGSTTSVEDPASLAQELLARSIVLYEDLAEFYSREYRSAKIFSRDIGMDFRYQAALLKYVVGDPSWGISLASLAIDASDADLFGSFQPAPHVFVYGFLLPPRIAELEVSSDGSVADCGPNNSPSVGVNNVSVGPAVKRFYNPVQLSVYTCTILRNTREFPSLLSLSSALSRFNNADYRIVLGHFEGQKVRFSRSSRDQLKSDALELVSKIASVELSEGYYEVDRECVPDNVSELVGPPELSLGEQVVGENDGYLYFGNRLNYVDATRLLEALSEFRLLRESYLIRPRI